MPLPATVVDRLRAATAAAHQALDGTLDPVVRLCTSSSRVAMLHGYHRLHAQAEAAMAPFLAADPELDFNARRRSPILVADLAAEGHAPEPQPAATLPIASRAAALGTLYVVEGATLGSRLILRQLQCAPRPPTLRFLDPYGADTGRMWRAVLAVLTRDLADPRHLADAATAAAATFRLAAACLLPPSADRRPDRHAPRPKRHVEPAMLSNAPC